MKILITGGAGFIGAHLTKALLARGDEVTLFDNFDEFVYPVAAKKKRLAALVPDAASRLVQGSILNPAELSEACARGPFDTVIHLAALANPARSMNAAEPYEMTNVLGTLHVLDAAVAGVARHVIFAGSSSVYNDEQTPFTETSYPLRPRSPYGASKAAAENYCAAWHVMHGLPITITRLFSVYGPWGRPDMAPLIFAQKILAGETIEVSQGMKRDFTYIDDIVAGLVAAVDHPFDFEVINLGRGEPVAINDLVAALEKAAGMTVEHIEREAPAGEMRITYADTSKARQLLGYEPKVSVEEGAASVINWLKQH